MPKRPNDQGDDLPDLDDELDPADLDLDPDAEPSDDDEPDDPDDSDDGDEPSNDDQVDQLGPQDDQRRVQDPDRVERRASNRIRTLTEEVRKRDQQLAETNRRLDELTQRVTSQPQGPQETPEQRTTRLALLSPEDRIREEMRESRDAHQRDMRNMAFHLQDTSDRASFNARATVDPLYRKWAPKVEEELVNLRRNGQNVDRERLLAYMIGKAALDARGSKEAGKTIREAGRRVRRAQTRPSNSRSDAEPRGERRSNSLEKRLENQPL